MKTENISVTGANSPKSRRLIAVALVLTIMFAFGGAQAFAAKDQRGGYSGDYNVGGYSGPGPALVTVEQAKGMNDDARVALKGNITRSLGGKHYEFKDATGTVTVEIGNKRWQGRNIGPEDLVEIQGEVDKEWNGMEIDVKQIITEGAR